MGIKTINIEEAEHIKYMIMAESEKAKQAVQNVMNLLQSYTRWEGAFPKFDQKVNASKQQLEHATAMIDEAASKIEAAILDFTEHEGVFGL